jgi:hypothetical protein
LHDITLGNGGAISATGSAMAILIITNSAFNENQARFGGAINIESFRVSFQISGCNFTENTAREDGGSFPSLHSTSLPTGLFYEVLYDMNDI